jgi:hypothetical protein
VRREAALHPCIGKMAVDETHRDLIACLFVGDGDHRQLQFPADDTGPTRSALAWGAVSGIGSALGVLSLYDGLAVPILPSNP